MEKIYKPNKEIIDKYANVLVNFGLNNGKGIKPNEVVLIVVPECAKPILKPIYNHVLKAGGHPIIQYIPDGIEAEIYKNGTNEQISFFPTKLMKGRIDEINHQITIISDKNPKALAGINPKKIMSRQKSMLQYRKWRDEKESKNEFSWTLCIYPTNAKAQDANMTLEEYWNEIIKVCYLEEQDPVKKWKELQTEIDWIIKKLDALKIKKVHIKAKNTDLHLKIGENRKWLGGRGCNIPSFEIFTSPDWKGTNGHIEISENLYRYGNLIKGIKLEFENGIITKYSAEENEDLLKEMINVENADKLGEFSLTDSRHSKITKFMAETLYDENVGGENGNTHIAIGTSFNDAYNGDVTKLSEEDFKNLGFNKSAIHTDLVSTTKRTVTATLQDGTKKIIYKDGQFQI